MKIELFCVLLHIEPLYFFETVNLIYKKFTKCNVGYDHGFTWQSVSTNFISENPKQESWKQIQLCTDRQGHLNLWPPAFTLSPKPHCHNVITLVRWSALLFLICHYHICYGFRYSCCRCFEKRSIRTHCNVWTHACYIWGKVIGALTWSFTMCCVLKL